MPYVQVHTSLIPDIGSKYQYDTIY